MSSESTEVSEHGETVTAVRESADDETAQFAVVPTEEDDTPAEDVAEPPTEALATVQQLRAPAEAVDPIDDEAQLRAEYEALREQGRRESAAAAAAEPQRAEDDGQVPAPSRARRGRFDPEAAERARAYKYSRRRRVVLVLLALTVGFAIGSVVVSPMLWIADVVAVLLLVLYLTYLRRQVKVEADIRERRLARLQRARQIRPEAGRVGGPEYGRAVTEDGGSAYHRRGRVAVDLDDDDPAFDDLEQYAPVVYQRASGQ